MKQFAIIAAAIALASCQKDEIQPPTSAQAFGKVCVMQVSDGYHNSLPISFELDDQSIQSNAMPTEVPRYSTPDVAERLAAILADPPAMAAAWIRWNRVTEKV